jgi:hypothetical protein
MAPQHPRSPVADAFDGASGRARGRAETGVVRFARRVLVARAAGLAAEPCPRPIMRRVASLLHERAPATAIRLLRLLFDSLHAPVPARRGRRGARWLRFGAEGVALDVRITRLRGGVRLEVGLEGPRPRCIELRTAGRDRGAPLALSAGGTAVARVARTAKDVRIELRLVSGRRFRTPALPLRD